MIDQTVDAVVFDWEIAGGIPRPAPVAALRRRVEALSAASVDVAVLSKSPVGAVDVRLRARPQGPGHLLVCGSNGAELSEIEPDGLWTVRPQGGEQATGSEALRGLFASFAERGVALDWCSSSASSGSQPEPPAAQRCCSRCPRLRAQSR